MQIDLLGLEAKDLEWYQMCIRAMIAFVVAIIYIRLSGMRTFGTKSAFDVVVSITLGAILSRSITGHYPFFSCLAATGVLAFMHRLTALLVFKSNIIRKLCEGDPILLYKNGKRMNRELKKYSITGNDLLQAVHEQNLDGFNQVKSIWLETDGKLSIVKKEGE